MVKKFNRLWVVLFSMLALLCMGLFAACGEKEGDGGSTKREVPPAAVSEASITYDGASVRWQPVSAASHYQLQINGAEYTSYNNGQYNYAYTTMDADNYVISITAVNNYGSSSPATRTFHKLAAPENIVFDEDGEMSWDNVANASSYIVEVNNQEKPIDKNVFSDFEYGKKNNIRVKAVGGEDTFAVWSSVITKTYLATPTDVAYDGQYISWRGANNSTSYTLYIDGMEIPEVTGNTYRYDANGNDFVVEIRADGRGDPIFPSKLSEEKEFIFLGAIENLHVNDSGMLVWDAVEKANGYKLEVKNTNGTILDEGTVTTTEKALPDGIQLKIRIKPVANGNATYFSTWSEETPFALSGAPVLKWHDEFALTDGNAAEALYWDTPKGDVSGYNVKIVFTPANGSAPQETITSALNINPTFSYAYTEVGEYKIQVQTVAPLGGIWSNSRYCNPITVVRLPAPSEANENFIVSNAIDVTQGFKVNFKGVSGATAYRLWKDGAATQIQVTGNSTSMTVTNVVDGTVTETVTSHYGLQSVGGVKNVGGSLTVNLGSLNTDLLPIDITVLATPENFDIQGDEASWDSVPNAVQYAVHTGNAGKTETSVNCYYSLKGITTVGTHNLSLCAAGNGAEILPSNYTKAIPVVKLAAPMNIRVHTDENEGKLYWTNVDNAKSYNIYLNGNNTPVADDKIDNMNRYLDETGGVAVVMETVANYWNPEHTTYYASSQLSNTKIFKKLATVTFPSPAFVGNSLVWNAPENVTLSTNVRYQVWIDGYLNNMQSDGASLDLSTLEAGMHTFKVRCLGDGENTINAETSREISITKLATPTLRRSKTQYVWNSVAGAAAYQVYIGSELVETLTYSGVNEYAYTPKFNSITTYKVRVVAVGDNGYTTINSNAAELEQVVKQLSAPAFTFAYDKPNYDPNAKINMTITQTDSNAGGYIYAVNGISSEKAGVEYGYNAQNHGKYVLAVKAVGGVFDEEDVFWIDSNFTGGNASTTITVFDAPNVNNIEISIDGNITGFVVSGATKYRLIITYTDGSAATEKELTIASYYEANYKNIATISVCVVGNGKTTISSELVSKSYA